MGKENEVPDKAQRQQRRCGDVWDAFPASGACQCKRTDSEVPRIKYCPDDWALEGLMWFS